MVDVPEGKVVAPYIGTVDSSMPSFSGYFLRDLHVQGRLNTDVIRRVVTEQGTTSTFDEVMAAITDIRGIAITETLARDLDKIASVGSSMN